MSEPYPTSAYSTIKLFAQNIGPILAARIYLRKAELQGRKIRVWGRPETQIWGTLIVGDRVRLVSTITPMEIAVQENAVLEIGENTFINYGTSIAAYDCVKIGKNCLVGTYVNISDNNFHRSEPDRRNEIPESRPVILEDNVWLGTRAIILPGVKIGAGSIVGAGSVVTHDIPPRVVAAGVPAKVIHTIPD